MNRPVDERERRTPLPLAKAADMLLEECRMVLPGVQALLGFQLVVVFNSAFAERLSSPEQLAHLVATLCVVTAVGLVMAPAALHRVREPTSVSEAFIRISTRLLMLGMVPLACGMTIDVFLVARVLARSTAAAVASAAFALMVFIGLWTLLPTLARLQGEPGARESDAPARVG